MSALTDNKERKEDKKIRGRLMLSTAFMLLSMLATSDHVCVLCCCKGSILGYLIMCFVCSMP
jgi:hypothetical protein